MKDKITQTADDAKIVYKNFVRLIEALSLMSTSAFTIYGAIHYIKNTRIEAGLLFVAGVIALRGAYEFLRHLAQKG